MTLGETLAPKRLICVRAKSLQSCLTLSDPMNCSLPGSSVHGILQARILEWTIMTFPNQGSNLHFLCLLHWQAGSLPLVPPGKPQKIDSQRLFADTTLRGWGSKSFPPEKGSGQCTLEPTAGVKREKAEVLMGNWKGKEK